MQIFIDADGCPVIKLAILAALRHKIKCTLICDTSHEFNYDGVETITVDKGADSADFKTVNLASAGDIVITQDYGLAAMCLAKRTRVLNQDGLIYDTDNIDALLQSRYKAKKIRSSGGRIKGPPKRVPEQDKRFAEALEALIGEAK